MESPSTICSKRRYSGQTIGFISVSDQPPQKQLYQDNGAVWLHSIAASSVELASHLLKETFSLLPQSNSIIIDASVCPDWLTTLFTVPLEGGNLILCTRARCVNGIRIRRARVEDHDDLIPIFQNNGDTLLQDYFLAKLIAEQDEHNKTLVAEIDGRAIGMMSLSTQADIEQLRSSFLLEDYADLLSLNGNEELNGAAINLFCIQPQLASQAYEFFQYAFEEFPNRDYILFTTLHQTGSNPLSSFMQFVPSSMDSNAPFALYIMHHNSIQKTLSIVSPDFEQKKKLKETLEEGEDTTTDWDALMQEDSVEKMYLLRAGDEDIGYVLTSSEIPIDQLRSNYKLDELIDHDHHHGRHLILKRFEIHPHYSSVKRKILRELLKITGTTCIFALCNDQLSFPWVYSEMISVQRRKQYIVPYLLDGYHSLSILPIGEICFPRSYHNGRIIIVGGGDIGLSVIEQLSHIRDIQFTGITLISPEGIVREKRGRGSFQCDSYCYAPHELDQIRLEDKSHVVRIDRTRKEVTLLDGTILSYDELLLVPGMQEQTYTKLFGPPGQNPTVHGVYAPSYRYNEVDACIDTIARFEEDWKAVVLGGTLESYACIEALLTRGLKGNQIVHVNHSTSSSENVFHRDHIYEAVRSRMSEEGVETIIEMKIKSVEVIEGTISTVILEPITEGGREARIDCQLLLCCDHESLGVDDYLFQAIMESCLVYDGRLVVDSEFRTNDPCIYSIGKAAKYGHSTHNNNPTDAPFAHYNSRELGVRLANTLLRHVQGFEEVGGNTTVKFKESKSRGCVLPGGIHYMHCSRPRIGHSLSLLEKGRDLESNCGDHGKIWIHVDVYGYVDTVTHLDRLVNDSTVSEGLYRTSLKLISLIGVHEKNMNQLIQRYDEGSIKDFSAYFDEKWALALFHDGFNQLHSDLKSTFDENQPELLELKKLIAETVDQKLVEGVQDLSEQLSKSIPNWIKLALQAKLIEHIKKNQQELNTYMIEGKPLDV
ncbi:hypothetical protein PROFUN_09119 [Planoprotostelium fungivorum]|uniref:FAD/NAD(P)-binding domain-containing protein n=1 Tax=Planoprotostelium fungivorum TaxID=1890364 RepID=A0A2P6NHY4_9EUKA|nr:hypothetical protein PROFUN_09119 [Planoprotostelium fungivorum]